MRNLIYLLFALLRMTTVFQFIILAKRTNKAKKKKKNQKKMFPFSSNKIFLFEFSFSYYFSFFCSLVNTHFLESTENKLKQLKNLFSVTQKKNIYNIKKIIFFSLKRQTQIIFGQILKFIRFKNKNIWFYFSGSIINHIFIIFIVSTRQKDLNVPTRYNIYQIGFVYFCYIFI